MTKPVRYALYSLGALSGVAALVWGIFKLKWTAEAKAQEVLPAGEKWGGSQAVAERALRAAAALSIPITSRKRDDTATLLAGSTKGSDHHVGNLIAYAIDFGVSGARGDELFEAIKREFNIPTQAGTYTRYTILQDGVPYSIQLLWKVEGHFNHVHLGVRRVQPSAPAAVAGWGFGGVERFRYQQR